MQSFYLIRVTINIFYSGGLTFGQKDQKDETVSGRFVESGNEIGNGNDLLGSIKMEVVPPKSGLAEIDLKYEDQSIQVRPSTAFIRPLSLESSRHSIYIRTVSILYTGKSLSEALIFASINPQYDSKLFMELP